MKNSVKFLALLFLAGCATTRTVTVRQPMTVPFAKYTSVRIEYEKSDVENSMAFYNFFANSLKKQLEETKTFKTVTTSKTTDAQLVATCRITNVDAPSTAMNLLTKGSGNSTVAMEVTFRESKTQLDLSSVEVMGNSAMRSRSSVGGITLTSPNDLTNAALEEAAHAVASYVQQNWNGPAKQTAQN